MSFHIGPNGPGPCGSDPNNPNSRGCPFKDENGETVPHYDSMEAAEAAYHAQNGGSFGSTVTKKKPVKRTMEHKPLTDEEKKLREMTKKGAVLRVGLRAQLSPDNVTFDGANPERAEMRLKEAIDYAAGRGNSHLADKLSSAAVLPSGAFTAPDGTRVRTDDILKAKTALDIVEQERGRVLRELGKEIANSDVEVGTKTTFKDDTGTYTLTVTTGTDDDALASLPEDVREQFMDEREALSVERAEEILTPAEYEAVTKTTQVTDFIIGKDKSSVVDIKPVEAINGKTAAEKLDNAPKAIANFYGNIRAEHGSVKSIKAQMTAGQDVIKGISADNNKNTFSPGRSKHNGILVSGRRILDREATKGLSPAKLAKLKVQVPFVDKEKAAKVLDPETFDKIFNAKKVSLRVTEKG